MTPFVAAGFPTAPFVHHLNNYSIHQLFFTPLLLMQKRLHKQKRKKAFS